MNSKKLFALATCLIGTGFILSGCVTGSTEVTSVVEPDETITGMVVAETSSTPVPPTPTPNSPTDTPLPPSPTKPPVIQPRGEFGFAVDEESGEIILFGGAKWIRSFRDTWSLDPNSYEWHEVKTDGPACGNPADMVYDKESDRVILFLGICIEFSGANWEAVKIGETWAYDANSTTWTNLEPIDSPFGVDSEMAYDAESDRVILFGAWDLEDRSSAGGFDETWAYDFNTNTWTNMNPENSPPARSNHAMAYDAESDRVIIWGGFSPKPDDLGVVWAYDYNTNTWEKLEPVDGPTPYGYVAMAYHPRADRMLLYMKNEFWEFDYNHNEWNMLSDSASPGLRYTHKLLFDESHNQILLFAGGTGFRSYGDIVAHSNELWSYDYDTNTWTERTKR